MAVYNAAPYLCEAIDSVLAQSFGSWELLCVDDGSTDGSLDILQRYAERDARIKVFSGMGNQGPAKARNVALRHAEGEYVMMLDADDWLSPRALERIVDCFDQNPLTDCAVFTLIEEYGDERKPYAMPFRVGDVMSGKDAFRHSLTWQLHGLYAVRRTLHMTYPYDDSCRLHSDDNTTRLHYLHARQVRLCPAQYHYRKHADSISFVIHPTHFEYLDANLSMKRLLERELDEAHRKGDDQQVAFIESALTTYEQHRWLQYVDKHWFLYQHRRAFTAQQKTLIRQKLRHFYGTFTHPSPIKFGYTRIRPYWLFLAQEWLYFRLR